MNLPTLKSQAAFGTNPDVTAPSYIDTSDYLLEFTCRRGRNYERDQIEAGTAKPRFDNRDRRFDPSYSSSPYWPNVVPMVRMRYAAVWNSIEYPLHTGFVERWPLEWTGPYDASTSPTTVDAVAVLNNASITGAFASQTTGARIAAVLQAAGWPAATGAAGYWTLGTSTLGTTTRLSYSVPTSDVAAGYETVLAVTIDDSTAVSAWAHMQEMAAAEPGVVFVDGDGRVVFQDRRYRYNQTSVATFSDKPTGADIAYEDLTTPEMDVAKVVNEVIASRTEAGITTTVTAQNDVSRAKYWRRTLNLSLPLISDGALAQRAGFELLRYSQPAVRFDRITIRPQGQPAAWPTVLGLELGDMVTVNRTPGSRSFPSETETHLCFVEAVEHTVTRNDWIVALQLSPGEYYSNPWNLNVDQLGVGTALAY